MFSITCQGSGSPSAQTFCDSYGLAGAHPRAGAVAARTPRLPAGRIYGSSASEQSRVTRLVLRGTGRRWLRYLDRAAGLALEIADGSRDGDPELALAIAHVVLDHDRMLIGLPGSAYYRTAERRRRLAEAIPALEARIDTHNQLEMS